MRYDSLNSLRGIAALIVVFNHMFISVAFHYFISNEEFQNSPIFHLFNARLAVLFFFILSGFVLSLSYITGKNIKYKTYIIRRFFRIYVPFIIITLTTILLWFGITNTFYDPDLEWMLWNQELTANIVAHHIFMTNRAVMLNPPLWTLMIEMKVVIIFPLLAYLLIKRPTVTLVISLMLSYVCAILFVTIDEYDNFYAASSLISSLLMTLYYIQFFAMGIFIAVKKDIILGGINRIHGIIHCLIIIFLLMIPNGLVKNDFLLLELGYGLFASYIILLAINYKHFENILLIKPMKWLGRVSYSLYLIHVPILWGLFYALGGLLPVVHIIIISFVIILIMSEITYRTIEKPAQDFGKRLADAQV
tara:strand:- start:23128 stop:24213 length:1086 start_codon:yes stop_codon:yes gene_type:complete